MATINKASVFPDAFLSLFNELNDEVNTVHDQIIQNPSSQTWRRVYVRSVIALIEAIISSLTDQIRYLEGEDCLSLLTGDFYSLNRRSIWRNPDDESDARYRKVSLAENIECITELFAGTACLQWQIDKSGAGWNDLVSTIRTRNRITHPSPHKGIAVNIEEVEQAYRAANWFHESIAGLLSETADSLEEEYIGMKRGIERRFGSLE